MKDIPQAKELTPIIDSLILEIILGVIIFFIIKGLFAILLGRPINYFFLGIGIDGNFLIKRLKSFFFEVLSPLLTPLSFYRLWGLLPFKTIPEILLRIIHYRSSSLLGILGPIFLFGISVTLILSPLIYQQIQYDREVVFHKKLSKKQNSSPDKTEKITLHNQEIELPLKKSLELRVLSSPKGDKYKISGGKLKKSVIISATKKSFLSWNNNLAIANPIAFLMYPVHALKNINMPVPPGNAEKFQGERLHMVSKIMSLSLKNLPSTVFELGPFLIGAYHMNEEILPLISQIEGTVAATWVQNNGIALVLAGDKNASIIYPLDSTKPTINLSSISSKDLNYFLQYFLKFQNPVKVPYERPGIIEEIFILLEKVDVGIITSNIGNLFNSEEINPIKNMQNKQKELTNSIKKASKAKEKALREVDSE